MSGFKWTKKKREAALWLSQGYTNLEAAEHVGVTQRTIYNWKKPLDFMLEVDKLTLTTGMALRSERLRVAMRVIRQKITDERIKTGRDLLDWVKYVQTETDGIKYDLGAFIEDISTLES